MTTEGKIADLLATRDELEQQQKKILRRIGEEKDGNGCD